MKHLKTFEAYVLNGKKIEYKEDREFEKFFEILLIKYNGDIINKDDSRWEESLDVCMRNEHKAGPIEIYSVRRISDDTTWSLGDDVYFKFDDKYVGKIDKLYPSFWQMRIGIGRTGFPIQPTEIEDVYYIK